MDFGHIISLCLWNKLIISHPLECVLKQFLEPQIPMARGDTQETKERVAGPVKPEGYTRGTNHHHHKKGPSTGPAAAPAVAVRMWGYSSLPQGKKAGKFSLSRSHSRLYESPLTPSPPPPQATPWPLWRCEPVRPAPISSYCWSAAPVSPSQMLSETRKKKGSCVCFNQADPTASKSAQTAAAASHLHPHKVEPKCRLVRFHSPKAPWKELHGDYYKAYASQGLWKEVCQPSYVQWGTARA